MLIHCFIGYPELTNVQKGHHQPQCNADNMQQTGNF
jgi:hypothetical protein